MRQYILVFVVLLFSGPAKAVVGEVDTDRFPFVVRLGITFANGSTSWCSASISRAGMVSTAAHCIWHPDKGVAVKIEIPYQDADGRFRKANHKRIFYPHAFEAAYAKWHAEDKRGGNDSTLSFMKMTLEDIAFIVPDFAIEVEGFPHWGTEIIKSENCYVPSSTAPSGEEHVALAQECTGVFDQGLIASNFHSLESVMALAVGFGDSSCADYAVRESCSSDGQRRLAEVRLMPSVTVEGETFAAPDLWCTGVNETGYNPIRSGDSGGPRFIKARDGRWLFVGFTSGGHHQRDCASSLFRHLPLWRTAARYMESIKGELKGDGAENWESRQLTRFVEEVLDSWSQPNEQALLRLPDFYRHGATLNGNALSEEQLISKKREFSDRWPVRHFEIDKGVPVDVSGGAGEPSGKLKAKIKWKVESPSTGQTANGRADFEYTIWYGRENELGVAYGLSGQPRIDIENCYAFGVSHNVLGCKEPRITSLWMHNGSVMEYQIEGEEHSFLYKTPSSRMRNLVEPGYTLFYGKRSGNAISGYSTIFSSSCTHEVYDVNGTVSDDAQTIVLYGRAPRIGKDCRIKGWRDDKLIFSAMPR